MSKILLKNGLFSAFNAVPKRGWTIGAKAEVEALGAEIKVGSVFEGKVVAIKEFGAFVELVPGTDGMCHISELAHGFVKAVTDQVKMGDVIFEQVFQADYKLEEYDACYIFPKRLNRDVIEKIATSYGLKKKERTMLDMDFLSALIFKCDFVIINYTDTSAYISVNQSGANMEFF